VITKKKKKKKEKKAKAGTTLSTMSPGVKRIRKRGPQVAGND